MNNIKEECYELTLTTNYVLDWGFKEAIRELIQNGVDGEKLDETNKFSMNYDSNNKILTLRNEKSKLNINTLLLGKTSKKDDDNTIGQFGEGYKIATLVLTRLNKNVVIYNNEKNQLWKARFKNSEKWREKILAFYISENKTEDTGLNIEVHNVEQDEYYELYDLWLGMQEYNCYKTCYGEILTDEELIGKIFVNGLYINCDIDEDKTNYGYNFKPQFINLERDRKTCSYWDATYYMSKMITEAVVNGDIVPEKVVECIEKDSEETYRLDGIICNKEAITDCVIKTFYEKNKNKLYPIPVVSQQEADKVKAIGGSPVFVNSQLGGMLKKEKEKRIKELIDNPIVKVETTYDKLSLWINIYGDDLSKEAKDKFNEILKEVI